ncbi:hypothetical protein [Pelagibacterium luteolum]|uniref:Uncharacterized protein n=1 Tax=Pelagibacterium luteolum TaxID=440168 RepID=A0A1G7ZJ24_9HYPH|nr:hypothetical protein [Pelagibacterium luteolum]SDH08615.1 hypothetical protein SAMN04487974_12043 [Pelagibacterium luteolum]
MTQIDRLDGLSSSTAIKGPCRVATSANITLSDLQTVDGVVLAGGDRVLVRAQTDAKQNGIYVVDTGEWRRARDFASNRDIRKGTRIVVTSGTTYATSEWIATTDDPVVLGASSIGFAQIFFSTGSDVTINSPGLVTKLTLPDLNAVTPPDETFGGVVLNDPDADNNGYYYRSANTWVRGLGFPKAYGIEEIVSLGGTANAQTATLEPGLSPDDVRVFFALVATDNTGSMTLSVGGETPRPVLNVAGNPLSAGEWTGVVLFVRDGNDYRLIIDAGAAASAAQSASEAGDSALSAGTDADRAEAARDAALGAVPNEFTPNRTTLKALDTDTITHVYLTERGREGQFIWRTGDYSDEVAADTAEGTYIEADAVAATHGAWVRSRETYTVLIFGADPTGVMPSNDAFSIAAKVSPAQNEVEGPRRSFPAADIAHVRIPPGVYELTELIDVGGKEIYWILEPGARVIGADFLNGHLIRHDGTVLNKTQPYGIVYGAVGTAARISGSLDDNPEITGLNDVNLLGVYPTRDAVAIFAQAESPPALVTVEAPSYTATRITPVSPLSADVVKRLRRGMIIDTISSPVYSGAISTWAEDGSWVEVEDGWFEVTGSVTEPTTPPDGADAIFNSFTKIWAFNGNTILRENSPARVACTMELGFINQTSTPMTDGLTPGEPYAWIYDAVALGGAGSKATAGYIARENMFFGFQSAGPDIAFSAKQNNSLVFSVSGANGSIEMGSRLVADPSTIDFHTSGTDNDYDTRLIAFGGTSTAGEGTLRLDAATFDINSSGGLRVNGTKVLGPQQGVVNNCTDDPANIRDVVNDLLSKLRAHGLIAT